MKLIPLSKGLCAKVDDDVFDYLNQWKWFATGTSHVYAARAIRDKNRKKVVIRMHHVLLPDRPKKKWVDHRDGDGLNNQLSNLRLCGRCENNRNRAISVSKRSSRYKGVFRDRGRPEFRVRIFRNGIRRNIGRFMVEEDAARAYDAAARKLFGEFARLNFPEE